MYIWNMKYKLRAWVPCALSLWPTTNLCHIALYPIQRPLPWSSSWIAITTWCKLLVSRLLPSPFLATIPFSCLKPSLMPRLNKRKPRISVCEKPRTKVCQVFFNKFIPRSFIACIEGRYSKIPYKRTSGLRTLRLKFGQQSSTYIRTKSA